METHEKETKSKDDIDEIKICSRKITDNKIKMKFHQKPSQIDAQSAKITWKRISQTLDKVFFRIFLFLVVLSYVIIFAVLLFQFVDDKF